MEELGAFEKDLSACRFCPMCKPAAEVAGLTGLESHTTRGRALLLWRLARGLAMASARCAEILYQSTLDSISEAWCVNHYPVSRYVAAARRLLYRAELAPESVREALRRELPAPDCARTGTVLLAGEAAETGDEASVAPAEGALGKAGIDARTLLEPTAVVAYALGDAVLAAERAERLRAKIVGCGATRVIADGPQTLYALRVLHPVLGYPLPPSCSVSSVSEECALAVAEGRLEGADSPAGRVFVHDSRSAFHLAESPPTEEVLEPSGSWDESSSGTGAVYDWPRRIVSALGLSRVSSVWSRALARSTGADDGLWLTYPELARGLALERMAQARELGAHTIVADSLLDAWHLRRYADASLSVRWVPELLQS